MSTLLDLLKQSVLVQAILALIFCGAIVYLAVVGQDIPEVLINAVMLILGFYFGSKVGFSQGVSVASQSKREEEG